MSASGTPTLTYFDIRGLAELSRLLLTVAGVKFTDERYPFIRKEDGSFDRGDWETRKSSTPYGQVPLFTTADGTQIAQSGAIVRYISRTYGLEGANPIEHALVDAGFEAVTDIRKEYYNNKTDVGKTQEFWNSKLAAGLAGLEKNIQGNPFFTKSNKLTYVDVAIYYLIFVFSTENKEAVDKALESTPKIKALFDAVSKNEKIAPYVAARKPTPF